MTAPISPVPVFSLPEPSICDNCRSRVDVRWQTIDGTPMALCAACSDVGGVHDEG